MSTDLGFQLYLFFISIASPFGVPLEETFSIILAGLFSNTSADYAFFVGLIFFGLVIGDISAYTVAKYFEIGFIKKFRKYEWYKKTYELSEGFFNKYGAFSVFLSRFLLLGLGAPVNYLSGFSKYSFRKFFISAASGEFVYAAVYAYIGFAFRESSFPILKALIDFSLVAILILTGTLALMLLRKYLRNGRKLR